MGQAIGAAVQLGIAQRHIAETQRWRLRYTRDLRFNQLMHATLHWIVPCSGIPVLQHLPTLGDIQHRQIAQALLAVIDHGLQQVDQVPAITVHGRRVEIPMGKTEVQRQGLAEVHQHGQRVTRLFMGLGHAEANTAAAALFQGFGHRVVFEHQDVVEQCRPALPGPPLNVIQAGVFMLAQRQVLRLDRLQPVGHRVLPVHGADHRQGVDEQAELLLYTAKLRRTPGHGGAERHHRLAAMALQQNQPGRLHQRIEGDLIATCKGFQPRGQRLPQAVPVVAIAVDSVGLAAAQAGRRLQRAQLRAPEGFSGAGITLLQPANVVAIASASLGDGHAGIALQHFAKQTRVAPAIHQDVVIGVDQLIALLIGAHQQQTQQWRLGQVEALAALGTLQVVQFQFTFGHGAPVQHFDPHWRIAVHHLARPLQLAFPEEPRAQHLMGLHRGLPGLLEACHVQALGRDADLVDVVARGLFIQGVEQHALLHRRQGVDILHALGGQRQRLQLCLVQARQWEVAGREAAVARGAAVLYQGRQFAGKRLAQRFDLTGLEHQWAEGPADLQLTAIHLAIEGQPVAQRGIGALLGAGRFRRGGKQAVRLIKTAVELAQVVEGDTRLRQLAEGLACRRIAQVAQRAKAQALVGDSMQLRLDLLDRVGQGRGRGQADREQAGEPTQGAGQVDVVKQVFATMAFKLDQAGSVPAPLADHPCQGGQQQIVDLRAIGRGCLLQQLPGVFGIQLADHGLRQPAGARAVRIAARQVGGHALQLL
ncbi:hypothetical protein FX985_06444 [Pseudomonas extremaustralis]|uniref:Uncharacterized protein n=1 Tax=Pseudomonas extremaustralis TaxID=359110 RepID=A0A5M9ILT6_9PSED|nr:hypothetical protein FX985_06444 [Pseudomonas extremaustralis]